MSSIARLETTYAYNWASIAALVNRAIKDGDFVVINVDW